MDKDFFNNLKNDINKKIEENVPKFEKKKKETIDSLKKAKEQTVNTLKSSKEVLNNSINSAFSYTIKCPNCGATVGGNTKFCTSCGHNLKEQVKKPDEKKEEEKPKKQEEKKQEERPKKQQNQSQKKTTKKKNTKNEEIKTWVVLGIIAFVTIIAWIIMLNISGKDNNDSRPEVEDRVEENITIEDKEENKTENETKEEEEDANEVENVVESPTPTPTLTPTPTSIPTSTPTPASTPEPAVYYSTNNANTVGNGNAGKYAYCSKAAYDMYWIIDFDEGYVYNFSERNGEDYCEKYKITSGTLKDNVTISLYGSYWRLRFKSPGIPTTIVVNDHYGHDVNEFRATNLNDALKLRDKKEIICN